MWYTFKEILFSLNKEKKNLTHAAVWINHENVMLRERSQTQKDRYCRLLLTRGIQNSLVHGGRRYQRGYEALGNGGKWMLLFNGYGGLV